MVWSSPRIYEPHDLAWRLCLNINLQELEVMKWLKLRWTSIEELRVFRYADEIDNISKACRYFGISRQSYYAWKRALAEKGEEDKINNKPCPENPRLRTSPEIEEKVLYLRRTYHLGQFRISWYLERYHDIKISSSGVYCVLVRHGLNRLPQNAKKKWNQFQGEGQISAKRRDLGGWLFFRLRHCVGYRVDTPWRLHSIYIDNIWISEQVKRPGW